MASQNNNGNFHIFLGLFYRFYDSSLKFALALATVGLVISRLLLAAPIFSSTGHFLLAAVHNYNLHITLLIPHHDKKCLAYLTAV